MSGKRRSSKPPTPRRSSNGRGHGVLIGAVILALLVLAGALTFRYTTGASAAARFHQPPVQVPPSAVQQTTPSASPSPSASPTLSLALDPLVALQLKTAFPQSGPGTFRYATTTGPVLIPMRKRMRGASNAAATALRTAPRRAESR